jgi:CheY-like chemotaxis protein
MDPDSEFAAEEELGAEFSYLDKEEAPSTEAFFTLWQAQIAELEQKGNQARKSKGIKEKNSRELDTLNDRAVLLVENDEDIALDYGRLLEAYGFKVTHAHTVKSALEKASSFRQFKIVVVDIRMRPGRFFGSFETVRGRKTGVLLAGELINRLPDAVFVALTNSQDADDAAWFEAREFAYCFKGNYPPEKFARYLRTTIMKETPAIFIVHGHDEAAAVQLKNYIQNTLHLGEATILHEKPSRGMTVIEKFEHYADKTDIVFALFTPDDLVESSGNARARQNVLFEYGFFLGRLGRTSGKVFLLFKKGVEIPTDLSGIIYIDITDGIGKAGEIIRRELEEYLV